MLSRKAIEMSLHLAVSYMVKLIFKVFSLLAAGPCCTDSGSCPTSGDDVQQPRKIVPVYKPPIAAMRI